MATDGSSPGNSPADGSIKRKWRIPQWFPDLEKSIEEKLRAFYIELIHFNGRINLISTRTEENADLIHIADSILASRVIFKATERKRIFDLGSGNGLPGVVMAVLDPSRHIVLIDKDARKIEFLKHVASRIGIDNISYEQTRIEEIRSGSIECAVSRGFASISKSVITLRKACAVGAEYYHMKSDSWAREVAQIPSQVCSFWEPALVDEYTLPIVGTKYAVVVTKKIK